MEIRSEDSVPVFETLLERLPESEVNALGIFQSFVRGAEDVETHSRADYEGLAAFYTKLFLDVHAYMPSLLDEVRLPSTVVSTNHFTEVDGSLYTDFALAAVKNLRV